MASAVYLGREGRAWWRCGLNAQPAAEERIAAGPGSIELDIGR